MKMYLAAALAIGSSVAGIASANVCERSPLVVDELVRETGKTCDQINEGDLAHIRDFQIGFNKDLLQVLPHDLDGLIGVQFLYFNCNDNLTTIPADLLINKSPEFIAIHTNPQLKAFPEELFTQLREREDRQSFLLTGNGLTTLPESFYNHIRKQPSLYIELGKNPLSAETLERIRQEFQHDSVTLIIRDGFVERLTIMRR